MLVEVGVVAPVEEVGEAVEGPGEDRLRIFSSIYQILRMLDELIIH